MVTFAAALKVTVTPAPITTLSVTPGTPFDQLAPVAQNPDAGPIHELVTIAPETRGKKKKEIQITKNLINKID
jgi:hypothetical protein